MLRTLRTLAIPLLCNLVHALYFRKPRAAFLSQHGTEGEEGRYGDPISVNELIVKFTDLKAWALVYYSSQRCD